MRRTIWEKDDFFPMVEGRIDMDPSVVSLPVGDTPLVWQFQYNSVDKVLGKVTDIRLEDGEITGEVEFNPEGLMSDELMDSGDFRLGGFYTDVSKKKIDGKDWVTGCVLSSVSVIFKSSGANPGASV